MTEIDGYKSFEKIEYIAKGWSEDKKYCVTDFDGTKYLLRITPLSRYETRKSLFSILKKFTALEIPMCVPIEFGTCKDGVYSLQSWIDGEDLETVLPFLSETEQYVLGLKSGEILKKMHSIPAPESQEEWESRFSKKIDTRIKKYHECGLRIEGDEHILAYIDSTRHLLKNRPQCFQHGDYHVGNMMIENDELKIIDFDRYDFGDPWEEFNRIVWSATTSPHFATGQLRGYFNGEPPMDFWKLLALYISSNTLGSIYWAIPFGQSDIDVMTKQSQDVLHWYDNMKNPVPSWYLKDFYIQWTDGIPYKLKAPFDFSFLSKYGKVFKAFDVQGSGNISFGIQNNEKRYFVKFAGAPIPNCFAYFAGEGENDTENAIARLKYAVQPYLDIGHHPTLIKFLFAEEIGGGFAAVFEYEDAAGIIPSNSPNHLKFMQMPIEKRMRAFEDIVKLHIHIAAKGYVALDFYDGSILYNYEQDKVIICDIDTYQKSPYIGKLGLLASARYVSPEELIKDDVMDEITNVYTIGATAFSLFAYSNRSSEAWTLSTALYEVAKKAVSDERSDRQQSIEQFIAEWSEAAK